MAANSAPMVLLRGYGAYIGFQVQLLDPLMRIQVEAYADDVEATPRSLYSDERRVGIVAMIDQWYGPDYRYVKVKGDDGGIYILRCDEIRNEWALIMFVSARSQALATQAA
jgi:hypothetical protein